MIRLNKHLANLVGVCLCL